MVLCGSGALRPGPDRMGYYTKPETQVYAPTMNIHTLQCTACSRDHTPDIRTLTCDDCDSPLIVAYPPDTQPTLGIPPVSLGEGDTPVVPLPTIADSLGLSFLCAKLEFASPTGSFKDRGTAVMLGAARHFGVEELVEDSSGNAGASVAAYAARCGIKAHIFAPDSAPLAKLNQIKVYGAETHLIPGPREAAAEAALAFCEENSLVYASHNLSPYFLEGAKTFAHELPSDFPNALPLHIVMPVGNGSLILGTWIGLQELKLQGAIDALPRMHAVQADAVSPIAAAFKGETWAYDPANRTIAGGISVAKPPRLNHVLDVLCQCGGQALSVPDSEINSWQTRLAHTEGLFCEPTSAAAFAGLSELVESGAIGSNEAVLVPITGSGLKDPISC